MFVRSRKMLKLSNGQKATAKNDSTPQSNTTATAANTCDKVLPHSLPSKQATRGQQTRRHKAPRGQQTTRGRQPRGQQTTRGQQPRELQAIRPEPARMGYPQYPPSVANYVPPTANVIPMVAYPSAPPITSAVPRAVTYATAPGIQADTPGMPGVNSGSVSYTHLTLPTIYSV